MIVYAESNFILELAFLQEEHESCVTLLELAKSKEIVLVLPAFCIGESYEAWVRRLKRRQAAHRLFTTEIKEVSRSKPYQYTAQKLEGGKSMNYFSIAVRWRNVNLIRR